MANDSWKGGDANWNDAVDWDDGLPGASSNVIVSSGQVTANQSIGIVAGIAVSGTDDLVAIDDTSGAALSAVSVGAEAEFGLDILSGDGGSTFSVGGALINRGLVQLGDDYLTLMTTDVLSVGSVSNIGGKIYLEGCAGMDPRAFATLAVTQGVAGFGVAGVLEGQVSLASCALVEFVSGQIRKIAASASLTLDGVYTYIADVSDTTSNSALLGLDDCAGSLVLESGASVTVSGNLAVSGAIDLDFIAGYGSSSLTVDHMLTNSGHIEIGAMNGSLSSDDSVSAASLQNSGSITLYGGAYAQVALNVNKAFVNDGTVDLDGEEEKLAAAVSGTGGVFALQDDSSLEFENSVGAGQTVQFASAGGAVLIDKASAFHATLTQLAADDLIEFSNLADSGLKTSVSVTGAKSFTLDLTSGAQSAALHFSGFGYDKNDFQYSQFNGAAGLEIKFV